MVSPEFGVPGILEAANAEYKNGLLKVEIPFKDPMEDALEVQIN